MAQSISDIKKRIKSVSNTQQITKAMEVVSATKMRRAQELALSARGYAMSAFELLANLHRSSKGEEGPVSLPKLFKTNTSKKALVVVITSDKGLAGSLNANALRKAQAFLKGKDFDLITVGKRSRDYFKHRNIAVSKVFTGHGDYIDFSEVTGLTDFVKEQYLSGTYGEVFAIYTNFLSTLKQEAVVRKVLPLDSEGLKEMVTGLIPQRGRFSQPNTYNLEPMTSVDYLFEPSRNYVLNALTDRLFQMQMYHITLESNASEHSARMVAMKTASDNAGEIVEDLTLLFNNRRQARITQEIVEITSSSDVVQ